MRTLTSMLALSALLVSGGAQADTHIVSGARVFRVQAAYSTPQQPQNAKFLRLNVAVDQRTGASRLSFEKGLERIRYFPQPKPVDLSPPEGCAEHPMEWLSNASPVGWFKKTSPALLFQTPEGASVVATPKNLPTCSKDELLAASTVLRSRDEELAFVVCSGDLNSQLRIMRMSDGGWVPLDAFTVTDHCP